MNKTFNPLPVSLIRSCSTFENSYIHYNFKGGLSFGLIKFDERFRSFNLIYKNKAYIDLDYNYYNDYLELNYYFRGEEKKGVIKTILINIINQLLIDGLINNDTIFKLSTIRRPPIKLKLYYNKLGFRQYKLDGEKEEDNPYDKKTKSFRYAIDMKTIIKNFIKKNT